MAKKKEKSLCPCGSGKALLDCCGQYFLQGEKPYGAPTPEALMRSRYSAYSLNEDDYVLKTWAKETRPEKLFEKGEARPKWLGLDILNFSQEGDTGSVEFIARGRTSEGAFKMHEKSTFRKEEGIWLYVDGCING